MIVLELRIIKQHVFLGSREQGNRRKDLCVGENTEGTKGLKIMHMAIAIAVKNYLALTMY